MFQIIMTIKSFGVFKSMCEGGVVFKFFNNFQILQHVPPHALWVGSGDFSDVHNVNNQT